jgi:hypothetical protein
MPAFLPSDLVLLCDAGNTQDRIAADLAAKEFEAEIKARKQLLPSSSPSRVGGTQPSYRGVAPVNCRYIGPLRFYDRPAVHWI